jgi:hypothetical protein
MQRREETRRRDNYYLATAAVLMLIATAFVFERNEGSVDLTAPPAERISDGTTDAIPVPGAPAGVHMYWVAGERGIK